MKNKLKKMLCGVFAAVLMAGFVGAPVFAEAAMTVSPRNQKIILNPGDSFDGSFTVSNPGSNTVDLDYTITVKPFYVDEEYEIYYNNNGDYNQIVNWITVKDAEGTLAPNETTEIDYTINVPATAPAGGQYAAIVDVLAFDQHYIYVGAHEIDVQPVALEGKNAEIVLAVLEQPAAPSRNNPPKPARRRRRRRKSMRYRLACVVLMKRRMAFSSRRIPKKREE